VAEREASNGSDGVAIFLKSCWYVAAWDHELIDGTKLARTILEQPIVLYRGESGRVVAMDDRCCHRGAPLSMGRIEGDCIRCMYHGMKFEPSGRCIQIPGQDVIPAKLGVRGYPVVARDHLVWIWMGDPAKADSALIVDYPPLHDPGWKGMPAYMHYDANWLLIVDNLSDFAHLAFVHTKTLGGSEEYAYQTRPLNIARLPDGFRVERWHMNSDPPPFHRKVISDKSAKVDRRNIGHMLVPGIFFLESMFAPAGTGDAAHDPLLLELPAQLRPRRPEHRAVAMQQPARGVHGGQGDHRGAAKAVRPRAGHAAAGNRRRRGAGALPPRLRPAPDSRTGSARQLGLS
jgi:vanillate O-demethylase monooxygenase subunit